MRETADAICHRYGVLPSQWLAPQLHPQGDAAWRVNVAVCNAQKS